MLLIWLIITKLGMRGCESNGKPCRTQAILLSHDKCKQQAMEYCSSLENFSDLLCKGNHISMVKGSSTDVHPEEPFTAPSESYWTDLIASRKEVAKPDLGVYGCLQVDISLLSVGVPATVQLGILGKVSYSRSNGCWGFQGDLAAGFLLGMTFGPLKLGLSINFYGTLH